MIRAVRNWLAERVLDYLAFFPLQRGKWRVAQAVSLFLDGAVVRTRVGPLLRARFRDSTFWLAARYDGEVAALLNDVGPRDLFIDVGANVGVFTCFAASRGASVIALEPSAREFLELCRNRQLLGERTAQLIEPVCAAASDRDGIVAFRVNHLSHSGGSSLGTSRTGLDVMYWVPSVRLDDFFADEKHTIVFPISSEAQAMVVKIDVEGFEADVIRGMANLLALRRVRKVIVEVNPIRASAIGTEPDIDSLMNSHGYRPTICPAGREHFDQCYVPARADAGS